MTPGAHIAAAIEVLDQILAGKNAEVSLIKWGRSNRFAGSGDRYAIRDIVYDALRQKNSLTKRSKNISGRSWIIALLKKREVDLDEYFGATRYSPPKIKKWELDLLPIENESDFKELLVKYTGDENHFLICEELFSYCLEDSFDRVDYSSYSLPKDS